MHWKDWCWSWGPGTLATWWIWASSRSWWWQGSLVLQSIGLQRIGCDWVTELNWTEDSWKAESSVKQWKEHSTTRENYRLIWKVPLVGCIYQNSMDIPPWMYLILFNGLPCGSDCKILPVMPKTQVQFLSWEDLQKRKWQPTPVFFPGDFHGQRNLAGYSPWGHKESDGNEWLTSHTQIEFVTPLLLFYILLFWLWGIWDFSSPIRNWTSTPYFGRQSANDWTLREVHRSVFTLTRHSTWRNHDTVDDNNKKIIGVLIVVLKHLEINLNHLVAMIPS